MFIREIAAFYDDETHKIKKIKEREGKRDRGPE